MSDSEESYEVINYTEVQENEPTIEPVIEEKKVEPESKNVQPQKEEKEQNCQDLKKKTDENKSEVSEDNQEPKSDAENQGGKKKKLCHRIYQFLKEVDKDELKTVFVVAKSLLQNGSSFENAIITAINVSDSVSKYDLVQDLLQVLPVYAPKIQGWVPVLVNLNFEAVFGLLPNLAAQAASNNQRCEVDISPLLRTMCPQKVKELESKLPNNEYRDFEVDPKNLTEVLKTAENSLNQEFPHKVKHDDVICDLCEETPVGKRFKCVVCPNFDLCEKCVDKHNIHHPLIQLRVPVSENTPKMFAGLHEFVRSTHSFPGFRRGCFGRGFGRRGGGFGRRGGCRFRGDPPSNTVPQCFQAFFNDSNKSTNVNQVEISEKKAELKAKKQEIKSLKKEAKVCRKHIKDLKHQKKQNKKNKFKLDVVVGRDCKIVEPTSEVYFKWVIKNVGNVDWNETTNATWLKGHKELLPKDFTCLHVGVCKVEDCVEIIAKLHAPNVSGDYNVYFAVKQGDKVIGKINARIQVKVNNCPVEIKEPAAVEENRSVQNNVEFPHVVSSLDDKDPMVIADFVEDVEEEKLQDKPVSFKYQTQYDQIKNMGFSMDEEMLKAILVANEGDLQKTLTVLME